MRNSKKRKRGDNMTVARARKSRKGFGYPLALRVSGQKNVPETAGAIESNEFASL
jgi:hypothetical protein